MKSISLKLPPELDAQLTRLSQERNVSRSDVVRAALEAYLAQGNGSHVSCLALAGDLVGSLDAPRDLSTNPKHLKGYGH